MVDFKVAVIHDWLVTPGGGEKVLTEILNVYPDADIFSMVDFLEGENRKIVHDKNVTTSYIQKFPSAKKKYRNYLPFMTMAVEQFDLSRYDVIISSSHAVAKGVITGPNQLHVCYCHSPIRYAWDLQHQYLKESNMEKGLKSIIARWLLHKVRIWDYRTAAGVDYFLANSKYIAKRIKKVYGREAKVIYPNVAVDDFTLTETKEDYYFTASRMVPYKKIDLIVEAFQKMPDKKLIVIGEGPQYEMIKKVAGSNVELMGYQNFAVLKEKMSKAKAFLFAAEEDFGIIPVEAQACGTPVIAFGRGGALETVIPLGQEKATGILYDQQTVDSLVDAINNFETNISAFSPRACFENAQRFSAQRFRTELASFVQEKWQGMQA